MDFNEDGSVKDPAAFRALIRGDKEKLDSINSDAEIAAIVLGDDDDALQSLLKALFTEEVKRIEKFRSRMAERTIDAQRASATIPRDTVQLYKQLSEAGLQYGPAFRLLRNVHVPE
ncbi:hypothetical protein CEUSTIGMA_g13010.t1 [Chlamydomonas eustigma]|uniref:Polyketide synthase dehydratase domain-containing protein n=1 Tax=Chlamydomonas eustigma TaxID=1157962 RepID=A0A250XRB7_9CHLO|nr:hypothetical protein CEUSTIGMA_g13010.t1 [Chlamydomonas eustigma]|eukprot:GAX85595.1 hypothetical protein CEUSTIGMA_g13010.t1 [Chlamydomonas eustigma]